MTERKWRRIAEAIATDIRSGRLQLGDRIPAARDLATAHDADTNTALVAVRYLRDLGVVRIMPGSGTYVVGVPPEQLPERRKLSPLERRVNARIDALTLRVERLERRRNERDD